MQEYTLKLLYIKTKITIFNLCLYEINHHSYCCNSIKKKIKIIYTKSISDSVGAFIIGLVPGRTYACMVLMFILTSTSLIRIFLVCLYPITSDNIHLAAEVLVEPSAHDDQSTYQ